MNMQILVAYASNQYIFLFVSNNDSAHMKRIYIYSFVANAPIEWNKVKMCVFHYPFLICKSYMSFHLYTKLDVKKPIYIGLIQLVRKVLSLLILVGNTELVNRCGECALKIVARSN